MADEIRWDDADAAIKLAQKLSDDGSQTLPVEVLRLNETTSAIVFELDGVDYILTMVRVPRQRPRPANDQSGSVTAK